MLFCREVGMGWERPVGERMARARPSPCRIKGMGGSQNGQKGVFFTAGPLPR